MLDPAPPSPERVKRPQKIEVTNIQFSGKKGFWSAATAVRVKLNNGHLSEDYGFAQKGADWNSIKLKDEEVTKVRVMADRYFMRGIEMINVNK